jgi:hypothetical protein
MKFLSLTVLTTVLIGCAAKQKTNLQNPLNWGIKLGSQITRRVYTPFRFCYFEPALHTLPSLKADASSLEVIKGTLLVGNYPKPGLIAEFNNNSSSLRLRQVIHQPHENKNPIMIREVWESNDFLLHFKNHDIRIFEGDDLVAYYSDINNVPNLETSSGTLTLFWNKDGFNYMLDVFIDKGKVVATEFSSNRELD